MEFQIIKIGGVVSKAKKEKPVVGVFIAKCQRNNVSVPCSSIISPRGD